MTTIYTSMCNERHHRAGCWPHSAELFEGDPQCGGTSVRITAECLYLVERSLVRKPYAHVLDDEMNVRIIWRRCPACGSPSSMGDLWSTCDVSGCSTKMDNR